MPQQYIFFKPLTGQKDNFSAVSFRNLYGILYANYVKLFNTQVITKEQSRQFDTSMVPLLLQLTVNH